MEATLDLATNMLRVLGKGNKECAVPLPVGAVQALHQWLRVRGQDSGRLFLPLTKSGRVMPVDRHGTLRILTGQAILVLRRLARRVSVRAAPSAFVAPQ
jgi:site-specific recombinase XerC